MKDKTQKKAVSAKAGKTGNNGKTGTRTAGKHVLTDAQREAKRLRDRKRRQRLREELEQAMKRDEAKKTLSQIPDDVFGIIGRIVVGELVKAGMPKAACKPKEVEPGVICQDVVLPDGTRGRVCLVDGDKVDPPSEHSPLPEPVRLQLLRSRMAKEIADIVDAHLGDS